MNHLRRMVSFLLVLALCFGLIPGVSAAEVDTPGADTQTEAAEEETVSSNESIPPTEEMPAEETPSETESESTEPPSADVPMEEPGLMDAIFTGASVMSIASTQNSIMLFDYADNGNYTTVLNSQVACAYKPNGSGTTRTAYIKNLGWHFARYGGVAYADDPLYCIEPWRSYAASTSGNSVDRGVTLDGSGSTTGSNVWYALPAARREAIGLILLYSNQMWNHSISVTTTSKANNVVISQKETTDSCGIYGSDVLGLIQNDPRYQGLGPKAINAVQQKHLEHKLLTASATVDGKKVNMVEDNGSVNAEAPLTVVNTRGFDLPKTGDNGTMMFTVVGILLMAGAVSVIALVSRKKRSV